MPVAATPRVALAVRGGCLHIIYRYIIPLSTQETTNMQHIHHSLRLEFYFSACIVTNDIVRQIYLDQVSLLSVKVMVVLKH